MALLQKAYLGATPLFRDLPWFAENSFISTDTNTTSVNIAAPATAHTKGNWAQIIASTSGETTLICLSVLTNVSATNTATLLDIGTGASGSETAIIPDLTIGGLSTGIYAIPVKVPSGTRIAARCQSVRTSVNPLTITARSLECYNAGSSALIPTSVDVLGADTTTSSGTSMSGASGTWVEIIASTTKDYIAFGILPSTNDTDTAADAAARFDIGVGAAGSEVEFGQLLFAIGSTENILMRPTSPLLFGREIPSGSRLAIRHNIGANPSKYQAAIIAIPKV